MKTTDAAKLVRMAREDVGITQTELATRAGTSQSAVSAVEAGTRVPSEELLNRLLRAADLRPSIPLAFYADTLNDLARRRGLRNVRVFGSVVRGDDTAESDVDILAKRDPGVAYFDTMSFPIDAAELIGFPVDLVLEDSRGAGMSEIKGSAVPL